MRKLKQTLLIATATFAVAGCSSSIDPQTGERNDSLEGFNRAMWYVNYEVLDPYVVKPLAKGWRDYVPGPVKTGLVNVADNLDEPASFVNRLLEGEGKKAVVHLNRFWINTVFGLGGLIKISDADEDLMVDSSSREFGDTLGSYDVPTGSYVVIPGYGSTTPRQAVGKVADSAYPVLSMLTMPWTAAKFVVQGVDSRAKLLKQDALLEQSEDPYITFREAYFQNLEFKVKDGNMTDKTGGQETFSEDDLKNID